jgi:hypothetical protein
VHGQPGNQVVVEAWPDIVGDDRRREEPDHRGEDQAVDKDDMPARWRFLTFGRSISQYLRERLFPAHRED